MFDNTIWPSIEGEHTNLTRKRTQRWSKFTRINFDKLVSKKGEFELKVMERKHGWTTVKVRDLILRISSKSRRVFLIRLNIKFVKQTITLVKRPFSLSNSYCISWKSHVTVCVYWNHSAWILLVCHLQCVWNFTILSHISCNFGSDKTPTPPPSSKIFLSTFKLSETVLRLVDNTLFPLTSAPASEYKRYHFGLGTQCPIVTTNKTPAETM